MLSFEVNHVYMIVQHEPLLVEEKMFRVLQIDPSRDFTLLISLPQNGNAYCAGPYSQSLHSMNEMLQRFEIIKMIEDIDPVWLMSDDEIRSRYSDQKDGTAKCSSLDHRDRHWEWISPLFLQDGLNPLISRVRSAWIASRCLELKISRSALTNAVNTYLASGYLKNSLIPKWKNCGAPGRERIQSRKLGRPDAEAVVTGNRGLHLSAEDKKNLSFGWKYFYREETSVEDAYYLTCGAFYSEGTRKVDGELVPTYLPYRERPTLDQFKRWGPYADPNSKAWRKKISDRDFGNNYRGLPGRATDVGAGAASVAFCDTTTNDCHMRSSVDPLKPIGTMNRLMIVESQLGIIVGAHCSFEAPSQRTFLQAVVNAASPKVAIYARLGITITEDEALTAAFRTYIGDNGEYRSQLVMDALGHIGSLVEYAKSGAASSKGPVETNHHSLHRRVDHQLKGSTKGKMSVRGEQDPILDAIHTKATYERELYKEIYFHNNVQEVPELLTSEMRADDVKATRMDIYRWYKRNGLVSTFQPDIRIIHAHLLPHIPAKVTAQGIYLLDESAGRKERFIKAVYFLSDRLIASGLLEKARKDGNIPIVVRGDPDDLSSMWWVTPVGLDKLEARSIDPLILELSLAELKLYQDEDLIASIANRQKRQQARFDIIAVRDAVEKSLTEEKDVAIENAGNLSKKARKANIRANRKEEILRFSAEKSMLSVEAKEDTSLSARDKEDASGVCENAEHEKVPSQRSSENQTSSYSVLDFGASMIAQFNERSGG